MTARVDRVRELIEAPLLVTNPVNVGYLAGLESSNAAVLVEPNGVRVFTDFRYAEAARGIEGAEFVQAQRFHDASPTNIVSDPKELTERAIS